MDWGHTNIVTYLVKEQGAKLNDDMIFWAISAMQVDSLQALYDLGITNLTHTNFRGQTLLQYAQSYTPPPCRDMTDEKRQKVIDWLEEKSQ
ncbi:MAG: hypothetical protein ACRCS8_05500 [Brevinema sp.]